MQVINLFMELLWLVGKVFRFANSYILFCIFDRRNRSVFRVPCSAFEEFWGVLTLSDGFTPSEAVTMHYALCFMLYARS